MKEIIKPVIYRLKQLNRIPLLRPWNFGIYEFIISNVLPLLYKKVSLIVYAYSKGIW